MAAIDKTYISDWETFDKIRNWALDKEITLKDSSTVPLKNFLYYPDITKQEWDEWKAEYEKNHKWKFNLVLWNTPTYVDVWLIRNCPFDEIQDRLKEQYGGGWSKQVFTEHNNDNMYDQIKNHTSIYDIYKRNGLGKKSRITIKTVYGKPFRDKKLWWWIEILDSSWWYNDKLDIWAQEEELLPYNTNCCTNIKGTLTKKNILNLIRKWNLPKGTNLSFEALWSNKGKRYSVYKFIVTVK